LGTRPRLAPTELKIIEDSGHTGSPAMNAAIPDAIASFAADDPAPRRR
jgi:hypothetical protein